MTGKMAFKHGTLQLKNQKVSVLGGTDLAGHIKKKIKIPFLVSEAPDYYAQEKTAQVQTDLKIFYSYL